MYLSFFYFLFSIFGCATGMQDLGSPTADCSHEIKRHLFLQRIAHKPRKHIKKQKHQFADKGWYNQSYGFSSSQYRSESWTIKKAECRKIDAFELWCWRGLLRVPWTAGRSNQSILEEISAEYSLEELMLKLKL